jgi:hypothetical protein
MTTSYLEFAHHYVAANGNATKAAIEAGYSPKSARQQAYKLTRNPMVQRLIREEQQRVIGGRLCSQALGVLESIMMSPDAPAGARVDACKTILDRGGLPAIPANQIVREAGDMSPMSEWGLADLNRFIEQGMQQLVQLDRRAKG